MARMRARANLSPRLISLAVASCFAAGAAFANPVGHSVVRGQVSVHQAGNLLQITNSPNAIINWQSFSIGANEITRFIQQSNSSAVLNRVTGAGGVIDPSVILGTLQSNGRVFLINPNGILFGAGARVDVAGLVASSLNLSNADFLAGRLRFTDVPGAGAIVNQGNIHAAPGGEVYLVGSAVTNSGIITSPHGEVVLAAGSRVELVNPGTPNLRVEIVAAENQARNLGQIVSDAGRVGIYAGIINDSGTIRADSAQATEDGRIVLKATKNTTLEAGSVTTANGPKGGKIEIQSGDTTIVAGTVEAKGSTGKGGTVHVLGEQVGLVGNANIDASGATGGGTVLVGGDFQGKNPAIQNAARTVMGSDASIAADAIIRGNGGKVIVWSDEMTRAYGDISARGGKRGGNGGTVEVSSKGWLDFHADVDTSAPKGKTGTLLLDPTNVEIVATCCDGDETDMSFNTTGDPTIYDPDFRPEGSTTPSRITWTEIKNRLVNNNVIINTSDNDGDPGQSGNITVVAASGSFSRSHYLQLVAHNNINVNGSIENTGSGDIRMFAGWIGNDPRFPQVLNTGTINLNAPVSTGGHMILMAGTSVIQQADAPIRANSLYANALRSEVRLNQAVNMVNTLAGYSPNSFKFRNGQALTVGSTSHGSGIFVDGAEGTSALVDITAPSIRTTSNIMAQGANGSGATAGKAATVRLTAGSGGIRVDGAEGITAVGGNAIAAGGAALVQFDSGGNVTLENNVSVTALGGKSLGTTDTGGTAGRADVLINAPGRGVAINDNSSIRAVGGSSTGKAGGRGGIDVEAGSINVNGQSTLVADGGEGHSAGGSGVLSLLASGNIALAATQGGIGAFGGNGGTTGGNAQTTITSSGGSISVENMRNSVSSFFGGRSGRGVFAHGGNALHPLQTAAGGVGSLLIATDGTGSISSTASHIDAVGGSALGTGGKGEILVQSNGGNVSITNGYENDFFPGPPQLGNTLGAMGGDGGAKGGAATTTVITVGGSIAVADDVVGAVGGNSEGIGGAATLTMGAGGAINISASNVGALGGFGSAGGGKATVGFVAGGDITIQGPSPLIQNTAAYGAIGGNAGSGNGGDAEVTFQSLGGNITVSHDNVAVAGGNSTGGGTGGLAKLTVDAAGGIFFHESHIVAIAGGGAIGGAAAINLRAGQRIEIIGASQGGTTPGNSLLAIGGAGQSAEGLGAAEIFMEVTSPTGEIVVVNDLVHAQGGRLGESEVFGPARITLSFPTRTEGGFSVDGVDGATIGSLPAGCTSISAPACLPHGFVVNNGLEPTTLDLNFFVDYGSPPQDERFQAQIIDAIARILDTGSNPVEEDVGDSDDEKAKKGKAVCN